VGRVGEQGAEGHDELTAQLVAGREQLATVVRHRLADDLDAPGALEAVDAWAAGWHEGDGSGTEQLRRLLDARLGIRL
jgi:L-cysteine:1D-myo-inositol 2-amino-2-deoxy-alpha-D-glucopyranoside ligase